MNEQYGARDSRGKLVWGSVSTLPRVRLEAERRAGWGYPDGEARKAEWACVAPGDEMTAAAMESIRDLLPDAVTLRDDGMLEIRVFEPRSERVTVAFGLWVALSNRF